MIQIFLFAMILIAVFLLWIMLFDTNRFIVVRHEIKDKRIKKPFRAVVVADLHNKSYGKENRILIDAIRKEKPDVLFVAGDLLTAKPGRKLTVATYFLKQVCELYPIYYANGNHEHRLKLYPKTYGDMAARYEEELSKMGIHRLVNEHVVLADYGIAIYGSEIEKEYYKRFRLTPMEAGHMEELLGKKDTEADYSILLAHRPDYLPQYAEWGADMVLSGHVHGGVVRIPIWGRGVLSPSVTFFPKYDGGVFERDNTKMILSRGLGTHTIPFRLFNPGELIVIDFSS